MSKAIRGMRIIKDIVNQIDGSFFDKLKFVKSFSLHYFLKSIGINYFKFPKLKIKIEELKFITRKNTLDFWVLWKDYEKEIFNQLESEIKNGDTFIDIGANIGRYSMVMANNGLNVFSFEPIKSNFKLLEHHEKINNLNKKIIPYNIGLGNTKERTEIFYFAHKYGEASVVFNFKNGIKEKINIDKLDNIKIKPKNNCFMKIDVEGFEYDVLLGAKNFIKKYRPKIIVEIWKEETKDLLNEFNYSKSGEIWYPNEKN